MFTYHSSMKQFLVLSSFSLVTGLYEEVHGLVSNYMFDPKMNLTFDSSSYNITDERWWPYPPIWSINEQRKGGRSGVVSWPQDPITVSKYQAFNKTRPFREIIDQILHWFNDPVEPINFGAIYYLEPDYTGSIFLNISFNFFY
jgi:ectonucleotide pyrophosphatase/phosphodiesterase family protein 5